MLAQRFPLLLLAALLLAGCATRPLSTAGAAPAAPASLRGSQESSALLDNFTSFVTAVDGKPVAAGRQGWNKSLTLAPGVHRLAVEFNRGVFLARTELDLDARPGAAYELRQASDAQVYGGHSYCEFWIVDLATGEKATAVKRTGLGNVKSGG